MAGAVVIGIDPGSVRTGWGVVREDGTGLSLIDCGIIRTTSGGRKEFSERLAFIYHELTAVLDRLKPEEAAIEDVFQAKNASSALKLGQARGVAVAACASRHLSVSDYPPTLFKQTIVGAGGAEKEQVAFMVRTMLGVRDVDWALDTSDALGIAITHLLMRRHARLLARKTAVR